jgi:hypothetical protein
VRPDAPRRRRASCRAHHADRALVLHSDNALRGEKLNLIALSPPVRLEAGVEGTVNWLLTETGEFLAEAIKEASTDRAKDVSNLNLSFDEVCCRKVLKTKVDALYFKK